jgi:cobyrinic acid a,c-diamide synthase
VLGAVAEDPRLAMTERHLGLMPCAEVGDAGARVAEIGRIVGAQVDLGRVRALAAAASPLPGLPAAGSPGRVAADLRIGIARDRAFGFYYLDDLAALAAAGAELVPIDTLRDQHLPAIDGLFIGGGFPETCMDALEANACLRGEIRAAIEAGLPTYAECGGLMYLARSITWQGRTARMVGAIPGDAVMHARPVGRGYVRLQATAAMPWAGAEGLVVGGHEFHHSSLENLAPGLPFAWRVLRGHGIDGRHDGVLVHHLLASYAHLRDAAGTGWAGRFVDFVRRHRREGSRPTRADPTTARSLACSA